MQRGMDVPLENYAPPPCPRASLPLPPENESFLTSPSGQTPPKNENFLASP